MTHSVSELSLKGCVPVSKAGPFVQNPETDCFSRRLKNAKLAINHLIHMGWSVGCDGELLPPRWFRGHFE
jgi:hypothetical protein